MTTTFTACTRPFRDEIIVRVPPNRAARQLIGALYDAGLPRCSDRVYQAGTHAWIDFRACIRPRGELRRRLGTALGELDHVEILTNNRDGIVRVTVR